MVLAYVLITVRGMDASRVAQEITAFDEVDGLHLIYGEYDIIARIKTKNMVELREFTINHLLKVKGIEKTTTLIVADVTKESDAKLKKMAEEELD